MLCLECLKTVLRLHTTDIPRETPKRAHKTRDGITGSQTDLEVRTASTGRPEGGKLASGLVFLALSVAPSSPI